MSRTAYSTSVGKTLTFYRGTSETHRVEITPADGDGDVYVVINEAGRFFRREQARQFARALLEAAEE